MIKSAASADSSKTDIQGTKIQGSAGRFSHCTECTTDGWALARISEAALAADLIMTLRFYVIWGGLR